MSELASNTSKWASLIRAANRASANNPYPAHLEAKTLTTNDLQKGANLPLDFLRARDDDNYVQGTR